MMSKKSRLQAFTLLSLLALTGLGCSKSDVAYEGLNPGECSDGKDNDADGKTDCYDSDCADSVDCAGGDTDTDTDVETGLDRVDDDGDGYSEAEGDCDDGDPNISPTANDVVGDGIDQNCDGIDGTDLDGDGFASEASGGTDCNDEEETVFPGNLEDCRSELDHDCSGSATDAGNDFDGDGLIDKYCDNGTDCDDGDANVRQYCEPMEIGYDDGSFEYGFKTDRSWEKGYAVMFVPPSYPARIHNISVYFKSNCETSTQYIHYSIHHQPTGPTTDVLAAGPPLTPGSGSAEVNLDEWHTIDLEDQNIEITMGRIYVEVKASDWPTESSNPESFTCALLGGDANTIAVFNNENHCYLACHPNWLTETYALGVRLSFF
jgi:hypothetical protein